MDFPTFFYRCPGPHWGPMWTTYDTRDVKNEADAAAAMADGWCVTVQEAAKAAIAKRDAAMAESAAKTYAALNRPAPAAAPAPAPAPEPAAAGEDDAPPTRAEMLEQAARIGLRVDRRWGDEKLLAAIVARMKQQEAQP